MDKNTIIGLTLIVLVFVGFGIYSRPSEEEIAQQIELARQDSIAQAKQVEEQKLAEQKKFEELALKAQDSTSLFFEARNMAGEEVTLSNGLVNLTLNTKGGSIQNATLSNFKNQQKEDVKILRKDLNNLTYTFVGKDENIYTSDYTFTAINKTDSTVTMRLGNEVSHLDINYQLVKDSYLVKISMQAIGMGSLLHPSTQSMSINWQDVAAQQEKGFDFEQQFSSLTYKEKNGDTDNLSETSEDSENMEMPLEWVAFKNQFFSCVLIAPEQFDGAVLKSSPCQKGSGDLKKYSAQMNCAFDPSGAKATELNLYVGPNDFHILKDHDNLINSGKDLEMEKLVYLGWPLFRIINRWIILPLFDFLSGFGMNMGIVLLLLTLIVKAFVYPTTKKSYLSSARMRVLKPKVDALNAKYPKAEDAMKKQTEMMQLYREYGVSPMGGCLPMLIQMPIWIALFNFVPNAIALRGESFLWAEDLSAYDSLLSWDADLWLIGDHLSIFCILFCATNIINTWISMRQQKDQMSSEQAQQMKMMQYMMYIMPLMFFFMFNNYSSGLCYYYFLSGFTSILIMWYLRKTTDDKKLLAKLEEYREKHKNDPKKTSGMAARLQALQKQMEEQQKNRS
jgi:YidC/Oxa1 family membrane protein insertase